MSSVARLPTPGSNVSVVITRVNLNPLCVLVELWGNFNQERKIAHQQLRKDIQYPKEAFRELEGNPGDLCLVNVFETWYRARIVSKNGSNYSVFLIDEGRTLSATTSMLAWGQNEFFVPPPEVEFCVLSNVLPLSPENRWSAMAMEFLKSLCGKAVTACIQDVLVPHRTFLLDIPSISRRMYEMGFAKKLSTERFKLFVLRSLQSHRGAATSSDSQQTSVRNGPLDLHEQMEKQEHFMYPELQTETVETVIVTEVINPLRVFCQLKVFSQELRKLTEQITKYYEGRVQTGISKPETLGSPCASRGSDGRWYRCVLQQVFPANNVVEVLQVDYGKKQLVQLENIRLLAAEFFRMPVVTYVCSLHGIVDKGVGWTAFQIDYLKTLLLNRTVIAKFEYQSVSEGVHYVTLYGDENMCINKLFGSKENCLLECESSYGDYAVCSSYTAARPEHQTGVESEGNNALEDVTKMQVKFPAENLQLHSSHLAVVQHVSNPSDFWIQTQRYAVEFDQLMNSLSEIYSNPKGAEVVKQPTVSLYCAAKSQDDSFYRATVTKVTSSQVKVFFVDYGNTEMLEWDKLRVLPDRFKELPPLALKCRLAGIRPKDGKWILDASVFFTKVILDKIVNVHVAAKWDVGYAVHLTDLSRDGEKDISQLMCSAGFAVKDENSTEKTTSKVHSRPVAVPSTLNPGDILSDTYKTSVTAVSTNDSTGKESRTAFKEHLFPIGSSVDVNVSYIESPNDFWCQLVQNSGHLKLLMQDIQNFYADSQFQPPVEAACVACHPDNGMWYRALVIQKHAAPNVDVLFIDYGQTRTVSFHDLRRINPNFLKLKGQAFRCSLYNLIHPTSQTAVEWTKDAITQFKDFVDSAVANQVVLKCTIYAVMFDAQKVVFNVVDLETPFESVCSLMVQRGLANRAPSKKAPPSPFRLDTYYYSTHGIKTGTEEVVRVTSVKSVNHFYCQLKRNDATVEGLAKSVSALCQQLESSNCPQTFGTVCFAKYTDGHWYRGQIKSTQPTILVHFVDYGDTLEVNKSDLLPIPIEASEIMSVPVQAVECGLSDITCKVSEEVNSWFETRITDHTCRALVVAKEPGGKLLVELHDGKTQVNAKTKEKLDVEAHREQRVVNQGCNDNGRKLQNVSYETHAPKTNKPNPAGPVKESLQKRRIPDPAPYRTPHQRQSIIRDENMGNSTKSRDASVMRMKTESQIENKCFITLKPSRWAAQEANNVAPKTKVQTFPKLTDLPSKSIEVGLEANVFISHCNSAHSFFVQLAKEEDAIFSFVERLNIEHESDENINIQVLKQGFLVKAEFPDDSSWYRAVVLEILGNGTALVEFIDYGNTASVLVSKMCSLDKCFLELPRFSIHCLLSGTPVQKEDQLNLEVVSKFKEDVGANGEKQLKCKFMKQFGSVWEVSLEDNDRQVTFNMLPKCPEPLFEVTPEITKSLSQGTEKLLLSSSVQDLSPEKGSSDHLKSQCYCEAEISEGKIIEAYVSVIIGPQSFWCQSAHSDALDKITETATEVGSAVEYKQVDADSLSPGSPCIALFTDDEQWYRAEVIQTEGEVLSIRFVDYGNESHVNIKDVRAMSHELVNFPPQAFLCQLKGFDASQGTWNDNATDQLSDLITDKLLQLNIVRLSRNEAGLTTCVVQVECEGQVVNEVMKAYWKSSRIDKPDITESTPCLAFSLPCESMLAVEEAAVISSCTQESSDTTSEQETLDSLLHSEVQEELHKNNRDVHGEQKNDSRRNEITPEENKYRDEDPCLTSTLGNSNLDDLSQNSDSESFRDLQEKEQMIKPAEKDETGEPQMVRENICTLKSSTVDDDIKPIPIIGTCEEQPSHAGLMENRSESAECDRDQNALVCGDNKVELKYNVQVTVMEQPLSVVDLESAMYPEEAHVETSMSFVDQSQHDVDNEVFKLCLAHSWESPAINPLAPEELKSKEKDLHITGDEHKGVSEEQEIVAEVLQTTDEDENYSDFVESEFGRLQRAGETIAVGSPCVVWSPDRKTWCKAKVVKIFKDSVKVLLIDHDTEMVIDPENIFDTSSESEQREPDDNIEFDTASSSDGSQYYLNEDTDDSDDTIAEDNLISTATEHVTLLAEIVDSVQSSEIVSAEPEQVQNEFQQYAFSEECCDQRVKPGDVATVEALTSYTAQDEMQVEDQCPVEQDLVSAYDPHLFGKQLSETEVAAVDPHVSGELVPETEVVAEVENVSTAFAQKDQDVVVVDASSSDSYRLACAQGEDEGTVTSNSTTDVDKMLEKASSPKDDFEHQMSYVTHLTLKIEDNFDDSDVVFVSETPPTHL